mgnify:FL=1
MSTIKCYDTLKCMYVEVEVTEEVYTYIKRSYWREDMQDRRYQARKLLFDDVLDYSVTEIDICDEVVKKIEYEVLIKATEKLCDKDKLLIYYRYYKGYTIRRIAEAMDISNSYVAKLLNRINSKLKALIEDEIC